MAKPRGPKPTAVEISATEEKKRKALLAKQRKAAREKARLDA